MFVVRKRTGIWPLAVNLDLVSKFFVIDSRIEFYHNDKIDFCYCTMFIFENEEREKAQEIFDKICSHIESGAKICFVD